MNTRESGSPKCILPILFRPFRRVCSNRVAQMTTNLNSEDEELLKRIRETVEYMSFAVKKDTSVSGSVRDGVKIVRNRWVSR